MKHVSIWLTGLKMLLIASLVQAGTVYQWTDENGIRHFSNTGAPTDAAEVGTTAEKIAPSDEVEKSEQTVEQDQNEMLSNAPDSENATESETATGQTPTVRERAAELERERITRQAEEERRRLEAEIAQVEQRSLSSTFTEGMRSARLDPLKEQLALLDADPVQYFRMKREGAFAPGKEQSSNRIKSENKRARRRMP